MSEPVCSICGLPVSADEPAYCVTPRIDGARYQHWDCGRCFMAMRADRDRLAAELAAMTTTRDELLDCGQETVCAEAPGCMRHWKERNTELIADRDRLAEECSAWRCTAEAREAERDRLAAELAAIRERCERAIALVESSYFAGIRAQVSVCIGGYEDYLEWNRSDTKRALDALRAEIEGTP